MGRDRLRLVGDLLPLISIHSPRMGRDTSSGWSRGPCPHFNPLSPHGERQAPVHCRGRGQGISIHSPRMGRDNWPFVRRILEDISIHSPRMGRDRGRCATCLWHWPDFNPLSPHGERLAAAQDWFLIDRFQSTLPAWGETSTFPCVLLKMVLFQSTLPAWGETRGLSARAPRPGNFNPLSPHGERPP